MHRQVWLRPLVAGCLGAGWLIWITAAQAQFVGVPAGVEVDAQGVLRMRVVPDPSGRLSQQRLTEIKAALAPELSRPSKLRKISLRRLEEAVADAIRTGAGLTDEMRFLAGLTKLQYVFAYPEAGDIVIAGPAEGFGLDLTGRAVGLQSGESVVQLQDLIVALRSFPPAGQPTAVIGCSIDPTADGLARMQQFLMSLVGRVRPEDAQAIAAGLRESLGAQTVTVQGVPATTHFAQVLVEADYRMKLIGIGLENPPVKITSYVQRANPNDVARNALQRWYFVPDYDAVQVSDDQLALELMGRGVKLIGENERVTAAGARTASGQVDRASLAFVNSFTQKYAELARFVPVYGQLRNLVDLAIAAAYIQDRDLYGVTGWNMQVFGSEDLVPVETYVSPAQVESAVNVVWKGSTLMTPIGGGVEIQPLLALSSERLSVDRAGDVDRARDTAELHQLEAGRWWWD